MWIYDVAYRAAGLAMWVGLGVFASHVPALRGRDEWFAVVALVVLVHAVVLALRSSDPFRRETARALAVAALGLFATALLLAAEGTVLGVWDAQAGSRPVPLVAFVFGAMLVQGLLVHSGPHRRAPGVSAGAVSAPSAP